MDAGRANAASNATMGSAPKRRSVRSACRQLRVLATTAADGHSSVRGRGASVARACCFCWCCCCSCSCLAMQNDIRGGGPEGISVRSKLDECGDERPTYEQVVEWGSSFDSLMECRVGQATFATFLRSEYSDENILFWQACEQLKQEVDPDRIEEKARIIYEDFISILSPKEVSLDSRVRELINNNMTKPTMHTFAEAQLQIYQLMQRDSYPRFVGSTLYKQLLQSFSHQVEEL